MPWPTVPVNTTNLDDPVNDKASDARSDILDLTTKFNQLIAMRGAANGVASLGATGLVPTTQLPLATTPQAYLGSDDTVLMTALKSRLTRQRGILLSGTGGPSAFGVDITFPAIPWYRKEYEVGAGVIVASLPATEITIPLGVTFVQFFGQVWFNSQGTQYLVGADIYVNGTTNWPGQPRARGLINSLGPTILPIVSPPMYVLNGDTYSLRAFSGGVNTNVDMSSNKTWFCMKVIVGAGN